MEEGQILFKEAEHSLVVQERLEKKVCSKCKKGVVNMRRHSLKCSKDEGEGGKTFSQIEKRRQNKKSLTKISSWCCKLCDGYYQYPRAHLKKIHCHIDGTLWKNYFIALRLTKEDLESSFEINLQKFGTDYLLNPQYSSLDLASNANERRSMTQYQNKARETLLFASRNQDQSEMAIVKGTSFLCERFPKDQYGKNIKAGTIKSKLTAFQHYLHFIDIKIRIGESQVKEKDLDLAFKLIANTIKSLKGRVKMRDSEVAVQRSKFFWSAQHEANWKQDPKFKEAEQLLNNPHEVGQDRSRFILARNHLQIKIAKENGKRNLELAMLEISQTLEPNSISTVNAKGELQYVIYNSHYKNKKAGGISKLTLDKSLMTQLLDFIGIIRPKFETMASNKKVFITQSGDPLSESSVSRTWNFFQKFYDGEGTCTNQNFRQQFGRIANEFGTDVERRHAMDQQDHTEATTSRYYEQNSQVSVNAVCQNKKFNEEASRRDTIIKEARKKPDGQKIKHKMDNIKKGTIDN